MQTASNRSIATGFKYLFWSAFGAAVTAVLEAIPSFSIPDAWKPIVIIVLATVGKMLATYIETRRRENLL